MRYSAEQKDGKWAIVGSDRSLYASCADHGYSHESSADAYFCLWMHEFDPANITEEDRAKEPGHAASQCAFWPCNQTTTKYYVNALVPKGRPLCDRHRRPMAFAAIHQFGGGDYSFTT